MATVQRERKPERNDDETKDGIEAHASRLRIPAWWKSGGAQELWQQLGLAAQERLEEQVRKHPYRMLGVAIGSGYAFAAGMPRAMFRLVGGTIAGLVMSAVVTEVSERFLRGAPDDSYGASRRGHHRRVPS